MLEFDHVACDVWQRDQFKDGIATESKSMLKHKGSREMTWFVVWLPLRLNVSQRAVIVLVWLSQYHQKTVKFSDHDHVGRMLVGPQNVVALFNSFRSLLVVDFAFVCLWTVETVDEPFWLSAFVYSLYCGELNRGIRRHIIEHCTRMHNMKQRTGSQSSTAFNFLIFTGDHLMIAWTPAMWILITETFEFG